MYIHRKKNVAYLAHPRTASRSIGAGLEAIGFQKHRGHHGGPILGDQKYLGLKYITTVRNQEAGVIKRKFVEDWVTRHIKKEPFYCRPHKLFFHLSDVPETIWIYYEHLPDLNVVLDLWHVCAIDLPHITEKRKRKNREYQHMFTERSADFIADYFGEEIEDLGYVFNQHGPVDDSHDGFPFAHLVSP